MIAWIYGVDAALATSAVALLVLAVIAAGIFAWTKITNR